ncbi:MAG: hypothetical protein EOM20_15845 [Spartobacteria bacterium]|nr:hypothetical protein [Spartobacteria bacterium]
MKDELSDRSLLLDLETTLTAITAAHVHAIIHWSKDLFDQPPDDHYPEEWEIPLREIVHTA